MRIALVLSVLDEEYQISVYEGIKHKALEYGFELICFELENEVLYSDAVISKMAADDLFNVDCVILLTSVISDNYEIKKSEDVRKIWGNIPVVSIGQEVSGIPSLLVRTEESIHELVEHMVEVHKYRHFLFISGASTHQDAIVREKIFSQNIEAYKKNYPDITYTVEKASFTENSAIAAMDDFFSKNPAADIDAVLCANDNMAIGVYKFLKMNRDNYKLKDIAVTGFDDIPQSRFSKPSLTTVSQSITLLGEKAVDVVSKLVQGQEVEKLFSVGSKVVFRESCGCSDSTSKENSNDFFYELQKKYIRSENMLRLVSRFGQDLNFAQNLGGIKYVLRNLVSDFSCNNFFVMRFCNRDENRVCVEPVFTMKNGLFDSGEYEGKKIKLGDFYRRINTGKPLVFKYLYSGEEVIGCLLFDVPEKALPYINSISVNIAQALVRIQLLEERRLYAEKLEKDVATRTAEVVEANRKRLEVEAQVLKISEMERQRFSNDLHDDICQRLAGISMLCKSYSTREAHVEKTEMLELSQLIGETLQTTRQYAHNSYPVELERLGLNQAVGNLCNSFELQSGIKCDYSWKLPKDIVFSDIQALNVFRIIQEALHNVMKHSGAKKVSVLLEKNGDKVCVSVCDDGKGLPSDKLKKGLGLDSMQYRANQIDAVFEVCQAKPHGACISLTF